MGKTGPVPKRTTQRRRRNKTDEPEVKADAAPESGRPPADVSWHPAAVQWYESLEKSGQHVFYEPSDWATAYLIAESMSRDLKPQFIGLDGEGAPIIKAIPLKGASLTAYLRAMTALLVTEGDRRRARTELQKPAPAGGEDGADVSWIDDARARLRSAD